MSDMDDPQDSRHQDGIGSVGDEALKLFGVLSDLARQHAGDAAGTAEGVAGQAAAMAQAVNEHLATGSAECTYCPVCRVVHAVRETSPEVKAHLRTAATSLLQAAAGLMETVPPPGGSRGPSRGTAVERIDLDGEEPDGPEDDEHRGATS